MVTSFAEKQKETLVKSSTGAGKRPETWKRHTLRETGDTELRKLVLEARVGEKRKQDSFLINRSWKTLGRNQM